MAVHSVAVAVVDEDEGDTEVKMVVGTKVQIGILMLPPPCPLLALKLLSGIKSPVLSCSRLRSLVVVESLLH